MTQLLKQSTATSVVVGPCVQWDDGVTPKTSLTHGGITSEIIKGVTATTITVTASGGVNDLTHIAHGYWALELTATNVNTVGRFQVVLRDDDVFMPMWERFLVVPANVYDALIAGSDTLEVDMTLVDGTAVASAAAGYMPADLLKIAGDTDDASDLGAAIDNTNNLVKSNLGAIDDDTGAPANLEAAYDGTGYAGGTTLLQVDVQSINGDTDAADTLARMMNAVGIYQVDTSTFAPTTTQFEIKAGLHTPSAQDDLLNGNFAKFGDPSLQVGVWQVTDYDGTNKRCTVSTMPLAPSSNDWVAMV
jgi:hypothetical protein